MESFVLKGDFLRTLRDDPGRNFFVGLQDHEPTSTKAVEGNYRFLLESTATFATEPVVPAHGVWKAACAHCCVASATPLNFVFGLWFPGRLCGPNWPTSTVSFHPKHEEGRFAFFS